MKKLFISGLLTCSLLLSGLIVGNKTEASSFGETVANIALDYVGVPYVWGGTSPKGFDCSGFVRYTYHKAGVSLPRTASEQYAEGQSVSKGKLQRGDLVFFSTYKTGASHVGIYLGNNKFIHASTSHGVTVSSLSTSYYNQTYIGSKRIGNTTNGWVLSNDTWYYYKNGQKQTGWLNDNGTWYFLDSDGKMLTGWVRSSSKWYYLYKDGSMAKNTTIDGYKLDSSGAWVQ
ncbi:C40 family peptidase [Neobacillus endophyticus]|uniref:C40 family peptidase n=1 Tax=Neobacillus endophyticus TaxID=2738405 RepID=UPI001C254BF4|nr:C40 family peptidase [Neobacillus endophyticus]